MPWWLVAIFAGAFVGMLLLMPKPKIQHAKAQSFDDMNFPRASEGSPLNLVLGRTLIKGPNTAWAGDFSNVAIKKKQKTGLFSSKKVIVGYTYYCGLQLCLGIGKLALHTIYCDKDVLWQGNATADGSTINISKPNLFGGKEKGGGFVSTCRFYTGSWTQGINSYLSGKTGASATPAYRGTSYIVFEKANIGEAPQLRAMHFEVSCYTNELELENGINQVGDDLNPMEAFYRVCTAPWGGLNIDPDMFDKNNLRDVAQVLYDEGNGISLNISAPNEGQEVIKEIMAQIDGLMYQDAQSGLICIKLVRDDYDVDQLPVFGPHNITAIQAFSSKLWSDTMNNVRIKYTNRAKKYTESMASAQDLANISSQGRIRSTEIGYPGCCTGELATKLATREMSQMSVPTMSVKLELNREGQDMKPGDVFIWEWPEYGLQRVIMRIKSIDLGALNDNRLLFDCSQDAFAIKHTIFGAPESDGSGIVKPDEPAMAAPHRMLHEAAYFFAEEAGIALGENQSVIIYSATPPPESETYDIWTSDDTVNYAQSESAVTYTPHAQLTAGITASANLLTGVIPSITIDNLYGEIESATPEKSLQGYGMFYVGAELFAHEAVTDNLDGTYTLHDVRRALLDTAPQEHYADDLVWFIFGDNVVDDPFEWDDTIRVKATPTTYVDTLAVDDAPYDTEVMLRRAYRPMRPAAVKFDSGNVFVPPANGVGSKTIHWVNRSRLSPSLYGMSDASANQWEDGQQTVVRYKVTAGGAWQTILVAPGLSQVTFNAGATSVQTVYYEVYSTLNGLDSYSKWEFTSGASSATATNPDMGGDNPADDNEEYSPPPSASSVVVMSSEALPKNRLINIYNDAGVAKARLADASLRRQAHGFTRDDFLSGVESIIYMNGTNDQFAGMTAGPQFLSNSGAVTHIAPTVAGSYVQPVGVASSATVFSFEPERPVRLR